MTAPAWNPDYRAEFERRIKLISTIGSDGLLIRAALDHYANHPIDFIEDLCITVDPRAPIKSMPFLLFPRQRQFITYLHRCITDKEGGLVEKCRDMGATWLCCAYAVWIWLFMKDSSVGFGSTKESKVDIIGDVDSIFEKVRTIIRYLPWWCKPEGFDDRKHMSYMKIVNPENKALIKGEAGDNIGRGGRSLVYFKDEAAHYERPEKIEAALSMNTDVQIDISSVNGSANVFYRRRMAGEIWEEGISPVRGKTRVFIFDWRDDPRKTQDWYDLKRNRYESEGMMHIFAQEIDRDYFSATERVIIPQEWVKAAIDAHKILRLEKQMLSGEKIAAQDVADGGGDRNALAGRQGVVMTYLDLWGGEAQEAAKKAIPLAIEHGWRRLYYDCIGVGVGFRAQVGNMNVPRNIKVLPWDAAGSVLEPQKHLVPNDPTSPKNEDHFLNMKAQGWWRLRTRFYKTFRAVRHGEMCPPDEMIALPSNLPHLHQLCIELSQPTHNTNGAGKMIVDKKPDGAISPNLADSVMMCYCPTGDINSIFTVGL